MTDPLAEVVALLKPRATFSKLVLGSGIWRITRAESDQPFYCLILEGSCRLTVLGSEPVELLSGDFVLAPSANGVALTSGELPPADLESPPPTALGNGEFRLGDQHGAIDVRMFVGHCGFQSPDASLLVSLLPQLLHVRGEQRLATLVQIMREESREQRPAREVMLALLMELLLIETFRSTAGIHTSPGLMRGLADARLVSAIHALHARPTYPWTVAELAKASALSRTTFFQRFNRAVGVTPMEYLLAWRMALAKDLLRHNESRIAEIAERVGYASASSFSVAFTRHVGLPPTHFARD
ncbi:AraC family transcriptional regulator [Pseudomonas fluorescens]|uniref:AraC family transcriptional regulator n=1 Tax=Pseudomonas fluorescens TaxID=294 RepID=A0A1T2Y7K9_PSEFL|nr:AraC family transcriptional regulator [Pseudomonas fluorescens]OPA88082.1 AraC family transcriptional regulator [Pseudomonas fluorescens]